MGDKVSKQATRRVQLLGSAVDAQQGLAPVSKAFAPRDFVLFGLPHRRVEGAVYERQSGHTTLTVLGDPRIGVPFGQDRLIGIFLATAFQMLGRPENNILCFKTPADILRLFRLARGEAWESWHPGGRELRQLHQSCVRTIAATYVVTQKMWSPEGAGEGRERYQLMRRYRLWFASDAHRNQYSLWPNFIELDREFADDLRRHPVPINLDMVRALRLTTGALDLAIWQSWRSYALTKTNRAEAQVEIFGPGGLLEQLGTDPKRPRKARELLRQWQRLVQAAWPDCPNELSPDGNTMIVRPAEAVPMQYDARLKGRIGRWDQPGSPFDHPKHAKADDRKAPEHGEKPAD